jgi:hypothetical protein
MPSVNLLCSCPFARDLSDVSSRIEKAITGLTLTERESSNYVDERYFAGDLESLSITVAFADEIDHPDLPYWICIASNAFAEQKLVEVVDAIVRDRLIPLGFVAARFLAFGRLEEQRIDYKTSLQT